MKETRNIYIMEHQRYIRGYIKGTSRGASILILFINSFLLILHINSMKRHQIKFDDASLPLFCLMNNDIKLAFVAGCRFWLYLGRGVLASPSLWGFEFKTLD